MTEKQMSPDEEYDLYAQPEYQTAQGPGRRRRGNLSEMAPVRLDPETIAALRAADEADDRAVSS